MEGIENENERSLSNIQAYEKKEKNLNPIRRIHSVFLLYLHLKPFHASRFINLLIFLTPYICTAIVFMFQQIVCLISP